MFKSKEVEAPITGDWEDDMAAIRMESVDRVPLALIHAITRKRIQAIIFRKSFMIRKNGRTVNLNLQKNILRWIHLEVISLMHQPGMF